MKHLAIAFAAGVFSAGIALAQQGDRDRDNDRRSDRYGDRHYHHRHDNGAAASVPRTDPPRVGAPDPYAPKVGAPDPYATKAGAPNPYATRGGDPVKPLPQPKYGWGR